MEPGPQITVENPAPLLLRDRGIDVVLYDYYWTDADYTGAAERAGLTVAEIHKPLGSADDSIEWRDETTMSPLAIYVLKN